MLVACGPSAEEKAAAEKAKQDSIDAAESLKIEADATAALAAHDSITQMNADSSAAKPAEAEAAH